MKPSILQGVKGKMRGSLIPATTLVSVRAAHGMGFVCAVFSPGLSYLFLKPQYTKQSNGGPSFAAKAMNKMSLTSSSHFFSAKNLHCLLQVPEIKKCVWS